MPDGAKARAGPEPISAAKADFFRVLGHPLRVRLLELLGEGERSVSELQSTLALDSSAASQHLGALRKQGLLEARRQGASVYYRVKDTRMLQLLDVARAIIHAKLVETNALLGRLSHEPEAISAKRRA